MTKVQKIFLFLLLIFISINKIGYSQFYNGHQMDFGKNRVQYSNFYWSFYRFDRYDVYFNQEGTEIAKYLGKYVNAELIKLESKLNHRLNQRLIFIVYNKQSDFKQSNIGLVTGKNKYNIGGLTQIRRNK
ncbi:MAG: hypothetical protein U9R54_09300, partial [Bacteroidota bacterium]|nr:hypothetical protein [Bacteroidota bacterium]